MFSNCFKTGNFPDCLKIAEVLRIFEKGDTFEATNYRPISLLSHFDKILEKFVYNRLLDHLNKNNLLNKNKFGFRPNLPTIFAISKIYNSLIQSIDQNLYSCCLFIDLSKAFENVDHAILLHTLDFGVRGVPHDLLKSYLTNRFQHTTILNSTSNKLKLSCRVPQGSCLGSLLFLEYANDLPLASKFDTALFADDTLLTMSDHNLENTQKKVNEQVIKTDRWFRKNKLSLNCSKTNFMVINKQPKTPVVEKFVITFISYYVNCKIPWIVYSRYFKMVFAH